jgi:hypothetical protein
LFSCYWPSYLFRWQDFLFPCSAEITLSKNFST